MMFRNRDISGRSVCSGLLSLNNSFFRALICVCITGFSLYAATVSRTNFSSPASSTNLIVSSDSLRINVQRWKLDSVMYSDLISASVKNSRCPDVITSGTSGKFLFAWSDSGMRPISTTNDSEIVNKREIWINGATVSKQAVSNPSIDPDVFPKVISLTLSPTPAGYFLTYGTKTSANMKCFNNFSASDGSYNIYGLSPLPSNCYFRGDTSIVIGRATTLSITRRFIYSNSSGISESRSDMVYSNATTVVGCSSIGADTNGNVLAIWLFGGDSEAKKLLYKYYKDGVTTIDSGILLADACDSGRTYYYSDAPIVSLGSGRFAAVTWDYYGIWLCTFTRTGDVITKNLRRILTQATKKNRFPTIAINDSFAVIGWKGGFASTDPTTIIGMRFRMVADTIAPVPYDSVYLSNRSTAISVTSLYESSLNLAEDSAGNIASVWEGGGKITGSIWRNQGALYDSGSWIAPVDSIALAAGDSLAFLSVTHTLGGTSVGSVYDSVRLSETVAGLASAQWISLNQASASLWSATKGTKQYYQQGLFLDRSASDFYHSPVLKGARLVYNYNPAITTLDTLRKDTVRVLGFTFNDTLHVLSRHDSVGLQFTVRDPETADRKYISVAAAGEIWRDTLTGSANQITQCMIAPLDSSNVVYRVDCMLHDDSLWNAPTKSLYISTRNARPWISVWALWDSAHTGTPVRYDATVPREFAIQQNDSIEFHYCVDDTNDTTIAVTLYNGSIQAGQASWRDTGVYVYREQGVANVVFLFTASDTDTTVLTRARIGVNHAPVIDSVVFGGRRLRDGDTARITIGSLTSMTVCVTDTDKVASLDTMLFSFETPAFDSLQKQDSVLAFIPTLADTQVRIIVWDTFNKSDTFNFICLYPWMELDSINNPEYARQKRFFADSLQLIIGAPPPMPRPFVLKNSGNDTLSILSIVFEESYKRCITLGIQSGSDTTYYSSLANSSLGIKKVAPNSQFVFFVKVSTDSLVGDNVVFDKIIITTNDPIHPTDTIPITFEYNDLPRLQSLSVDFSTIKPYSSPKQRKSAAVTYTFPPHARIIVRFSEPMNPDSVTLGLTAFSIRDTTIRHAVSPLQFTHKWSSTFTTDTLSVIYPDTNRFFGIRPPPQLFIPTDSIAFVLSTRCVDRATTPHGPNGMDIHRANTRTATQDTVLVKRVDAVGFTIVSNSPAVNATGVSGKTDITVTFSQSVFPDSIDKSKINNRSLSVTSAFYGAAQIPFDSIRVSGATITFRPMLKFYYGDTVTCRFFSKTAFDSATRYPLEVSGNGIPMTMFDTGSTEDNYTWQYVVEPITLASVDPLESSFGASEKGGITLTFSKPLFPGNFDTDTSIANSSFIVTTLYSRGEPVPFKSIVYSPDSLQIHLLSGRTFYSNDSVHCQFRGLVKRYTYGATSVNLPASSKELVEEHSWHFFTRDAGLYTFPNPYKPSLDPRHCNPATGLPCGIWFKNLHSLRKGNTDIVIRIFSMKTQPIYDTQKAGVTIHFEEGNPLLRPEWKWDTRNLFGELVATGIYFYAAYDLENKVLAKGKVVIVR